jgi:hypothetical protein
MSTEELNHASRRILLVANQPVAGDADPLQAIEDALIEFDADAIVVAVRSHGRSNWLAHDIVRRAQRRLSRPIGQIAA